MQNDRSETTEDKMRSLAWRGIDEYRRGMGEVVAVRSGERIDPAFFGDRTGWGTLVDVERTEDRRQCWRSARRSADEAPLEYEPEQFSMIPRKLRNRLVAS